jgi:hypothetical protein
VSSAQRLEVPPDGTLSDLRVVGFHGRVDPEHTPARRAPIFADAQGRLVRIEREEGDPSVLLRRGKSSVEDSSLPGEATRFGPFQAVLGRLVVIVGKDELRVAPRLARQLDRALFPNVDAFVGWINGHGTSPEGLAAQRIGAAIAWYCTAAEGQALFERIRRVATEEVIDAVTRGDQQRLYGASWWLSRSALDEADTFLAAAGLEKCDPGMADALIKATMRRQPREQIEAQLEHARRRLQALCADHAPRPVNNPAQSVGILEAARRSVRSLFVVPIPQHA